MKISLFIIFAAAVFGIAACSDAAPGNAGNAVNSNANVPDTSPSAMPTATPEPTNANDETPANVDFEGTTGVTERKPTADGAKMLSAVRYAGHEGFDRIVFEFSEGKFPGYKIEYPTGPAEECGSGDVVKLTGESVLTVHFMPLAAHTDEGEPTIGWREVSPKLTMISEVKRVCDFEGEVEFAIGLSKKTEYRVAELSDPMRLVIDIKHK